MSKTVNPEHDEHGNEFERFKWPIVLSGIAVGLIADFRFPAWGGLVLVGALVIGCIIGGLDKRLPIPRRVLVLCWAVFLVLITHTFIGASATPVWISPPWMLLLFALVLFFWTVGLLLTIAIRRFVSRAR